MIWIAAQQPAWIKLEKLFKQLHFCIQYQLLNFD